MAMESHHVDPFCRRIFLLYKTIFQLAIFLYLSTGTQTIVEISVITFEQLTTSTWYASMRWCAAQAEAGHNTCCDPQAATVKTWPIFITFVSVRGYYLQASDCGRDSGALSFPKFRKSLISESSKLTSKLPWMNRRLTGTTTRHSKHLFNVHRKIVPLPGQKKRNVEANNGVESWSCPQMIIGLDEDLRSILMRLDSNMKTICQKCFAKRKMQGLHRFAKSPPLNVTEKGQWSLKLPTWL